MTVKELIDELKELPKDLEVVSEHDWYEEHYLAPVKRVYVTKRVYGEYPIDSRTKEKKCVFLG